MYRFLRSVPLAFGIPPEGLGELRVPLAAADGALDQIDPPSQIGESGSTGGTVEGGRHGGQRQTQMQGDSQTVVSQDHPPEGRQILQARTTDEDGCSGKDGGQAGADSQEIKESTLQETWGESLDR